MPAPRKRPLSISTTATTRLLVPQTVAGDATYSYAQVADRINEELGERPTISTLRAATSEARRTQTTKSRPRVTAGMPAPDTPGRFAVAAIEAWLQEHPRRLEQRAFTALVAYSAEHRNDVLEGVQAARRAGVSWRRIAAALSAGTGRSHSHQGVFKTFRDRS